MNLLQCKDCFQTYDGPHRCPWAIEYGRVTSDPAFRLFGLSTNDILDLKYYLDCTRKTPQQLKAEVCEAGGKRE